MEKVCLLKRAVKAIAVVGMLLLSAYLIVPGGDQIIDRVNGETVSGGKITGDVSWTNTQERYMVRGNLTITDDSSLTISPGVHVDIKKGCWINVQGDLYAKGTYGSPIVFNNNSGERFSLINVTAGGFALMEHVVIGPSIFGLNASGNTSVGRIYNSTIQITQTSSFGVFDEALIFSVNNTISNSNFQIGSGGRIKEGHWLRARVIFEKGKAPFQDARLKITISYLYGPDQTLYNSLGNNGGTDPTSDSNGFFPYVPIPEYYHNGSINYDYQNMIRVKLDADETEGLMRSWTNSTSHIVIDENTFYLWELDNIPPPSPENVTAIELKSAREGFLSWVRIGWVWDHDRDLYNLMNFMVLWKRSVESEYENSNRISPMERECNITGLIDGEAYDIVVYSLDSVGNPSNYSDELTVEFPDITPPEPPMDLQVVVMEEIVRIGGSWVELKWKNSSSSDCAGYVISVNDTEGGKEDIKSVQGRYTRTTLIEGLSSETEYHFWIRSFDDAVVPNFSPYHPAEEGLVVKTLDITPPVAPILKMYLPVGSPYNPSSGYFNSSLVGLNVTVPGENRTILQISLDGEEYKNPNPDIKWTTSYGSFEWVIYLEEGHHNITVRSIDPSLNVGPYSWILFTVDLTDPEMNIEELSGNGVVVDSNEAFSINVTPSDNYQLDSVKWKIWDGEVEIEGDNRTITGSLGPGTYNCSVEIIDMAGNRNVTNFKIMSRVPDRTPPDIKYSYPSEGELVTDLVPEFSVRFTEPLIWDGLGYALLLTGPGEEREIPLNVVFDNTNNTVKILPLEMLEGNSTFSLILRSVQDLNGNIVDRLSISFTTIDELKLDSDGDGIPDTIEATFDFLDPHDGGDGSEDKDRDGLTNSEEYLLGTKMDDMDSDNDTMPDGYEKEHGLDPLSNIDANQDLDGDGFSNVDEYNLGTDPSDPESKPKSDEGEGIPLELLIAGIVVILLIVLGLIIFVYVKGRSGEETSESESERGHEYEEEISEEEESSECPECGAPIPEGLDFCPECGSIIEKDEDIEGGSIDVDEEMGVHDDEMLEEDEIPGEEENDHDIISAEENGPEPHEGMDIPDNDEMEDIK